MIGNDIVDLRDSDARPTERTPAFDARVFTPAERQRISASPDGVGERWLTWGAKEAAFKLARKRDATVAFIPLGFEVVPGVERGRSDSALGSSRHSRCHHGAGGRSRSSGSPSYSYWSNLSSHEGRGSL